MKFKKKKKKLFNSNNKINEKYIKNIIKIGFSPEKYLLKIERGIFHDIFGNKN